MERFERKNEQSGIEGVMTLEFDLPRGRISACNSGFWSVQQATAYFQQWERAVHRIHALRLPVLAMIDVRDAAVQSAEVSAIIVKVGDGLYRPGDSIAMIVPTSLAKLQLRRIVKPDIHEFFMSPSAAETWLDGRRLTASRPAPIGRPAALI